MVLVTSPGPLRGPGPAPRPDVQVPDPAVSVVRIRRRLAPGTLRAARVNVRLAGVELTAVRAAAAAAGMTTSGYVAAAAVAAAGGGRPPRAVPAEVRAARAAVPALVAVRAELRRVGVNLNQLARHVNASGELPDSLRGAVAAVEVTARRVDAATVAVLGRP